MRFIRVGCGWKLLATAAAFCVLALPNPATAGAVVTGANCPSFAITDVNVARNVFMGREKGRSTVDGAEVVFQQYGSPSRREFEERVIGESGARFQIDLSRLIYSGEAVPPLVVSDDFSVLHEVNSKRCAIGYVSDVALDESVRVLLRY